MIFDALPAPIALTTIVALFSDDLWVDISRDFRGAPPRFRVSGVKTGLGKLGTVVDKLWLSFVTQGGRVTF